MKSKKSHGYSLIEMMVAMAIGLTILVVMLTLVVTSSSNTKSNQRSAETQTTGRYAMDLLKRELRDAGVKGMTLPAPNVPTTTLTPVTLECLESGATAGSFLSNLGQGIWGSDDANPFSANCIPGTSYLQGDILVIRKTGPFLEAPSANAIYFRSNYSAGEIFRGIQTSTCTAANPSANYVAPYNTVPCITGSPNIDLKDYPVREYVYYISPYTNSPTESPLIPALWRVSLHQSTESNPGTFVPELVASGVEHMQIQYQRALTNGTYIWTDATGIGDNSYSTSTAWSTVRAVRIWLLVRALTTEPGYVNNTTYSMGNVSYPVNDNIRREVIYTVVNLRGVL